MSYAYLFKYIIIGDTGKLHGRTIGPILPVLNALGLESRQSVLAHRVSIRSLTRTHVCISTNDRHFFACPAVIAITEPHSLTLSVVHVTIRCPFVYCSCHLLCVL